MAERSYAEVSPILIDKEQPGFVATPQVRDIVSRAMMYLRAGFPIHLTGPAGTGKTTIAMYVAGQIGRPVMLIHGDEEFGTPDLIGGQYGYRRKKVVDNFIQTALKSEESVAPEWVDIGAVPTVRASMMLTKLVAKNGLAVQVALLAHRRSSRMSSSISHHDTRVAPLRQAAVTLAMATTAAPCEAAAQRKAMRLVIMRDGRQVPFDRSRIAEAIFKSAQAAGCGEHIASWVLADELAGAVLVFLERNCSDGPLYVGDVQDTVRKVLTETGHARIARFVRMSSSNAANPLSGAAAS